MSGEHFEGEQRSLQGSNEDLPPTPPSVPSVNAHTPTYQEVAGSAPSVPDNFAAAVDLAVPDPTDSASISSPSDQVHPPFEPEQQLEPENLVGAEGRSESVPGPSGIHPADPEIKEEASVDPTILNEVLELGFEKSLVILALSRTQGCGGAEAAVNWILEHSNESDFESDSEDTAARMGGGESMLFRMQQTKMVFVVNTSLKMGNGKLAAQVGHATLGVYRLAQRSEQGQRLLESWQTIGEMKVVVKGQSTEHLLDLFKQAKDAGLFAYVVADAGRTQIPAGSRTVLGIFGPSTVVDTVTGQLKLL